MKIPEFEPPPTQLGIPIPNDPNALSVCLPTWDSNVGWAKGEDRIVNAMFTGYPRFFIHREIIRLSKRCLAALSNDITHKLSLLFPVEFFSSQCVEFLQRYASPQAMESVERHYLSIPVPEARQTEFGLHHLDIYLVAFDPELKKLTKSFWQHAGLGISSRYAAACLTSLDENGGKLVTDHRCPCDVDHTQLANMLSLCSKLKERIATLCAHGTQNPPLSIAAQDFPSEDDVFLFPSGMSAIWHIHQIMLVIKTGLKSACFGFPYTDTVKVLEKWGPGCVFFGDHPDTNLASLERYLEQNHTDEIPAIGALFCECPSNPLLQSSDLPRLRELANKYGFLIIIDDTIGNFVNVNVLQYVDVVMTSLSKLFSGNADVMGGSLVLNPKYPFHSSVKDLLNKSYNDASFLPDIRRMECNSRDFEQRVYVINRNTQLVCHYLREHSISYAEETGRPRRDLVIKEVFYPEWITRSNYDSVRRPQSSSKEPDNFGPLFSLTFTNLEASAAFYDALPCCKGPSLGTNFTLTCPYTILGHFWELDWAAKYGVEEGLVRVSVGMENWDTVLKGWFARAVHAAESVQVVQ
ncbi:pyridoxal phosphate-dependent transferase [Abortiporus biennis]|nr:pyridoxal phosphate-dependent transferase [Abortiporus biennis]